MHRGEARCRGSSPFSSFDNCSFLFSFCREDSSGRL